MSIRILLADDHSLVREGLRILLEQRGLKVVAEASDGQEALRVAAQNTFDVAILDLSMPLMNGIEVARELIRTGICTKNILLTMHRDERYLVEAFRAGVLGYILKSRAGFFLIDAINEVYRGETYFCPTLASSLGRALLDDEADLEDPLSPRERQVLQLVAEGKTTKEIASLLGISTKTA
jgi:two-component system, NarL family, response regulator NreC